MARCTEERNEKSADVEVRIEEPFPANRLREVYDWSLPYWKYVAHDGIPKTPEGWLDAQFSLIIRPDVRTWGVWRGEELGGYIWAGIDGWIARGHCVFKKSFWGHETTLVAIRLAIDQLFADGIEKIELWCHEDNRRVRGLFKALGAVEEGVLSRQTKRDGKLMSMVVYGVLRGSDEKAQGKSR